MELGQQIHLIALQSSELKKTCSILGYKSQLDDLQVTVSTISIVLRSAEAKQASIKEGEWPVHSLCFCIVGLVQISHQ
ncbi:hypothetical protein SOVF_018070 isoform A [Spinacia oleracea]|nr:hypothetical protein SOVF_018070 isoform A [Spinacia oleracea]